MFSPLKTKAHNKLFLFQSGKLLAANNNPYGATNFMETKCKANLREGGRVLLWRSNTAEGTIQGLIVDGSNLRVTQSPCQSLYVLQGEFCRDTKMSVQARAPPASQMLTFDCPLSLFCKTTADE